MKFRKILAAVLTMTLLAGCGGNTDTAEIEALLDQAKTTMATVESMSAEMTMLFTELATTVSFLKKMIL